jgi:hypothetical protein
MYGFGSGRKVAQNLRNSSPGRSWGRHRGRSGPPERIIDVDLVPSTSRYSRLMDASERRSRALVPLYALLVVAGLMAAFFITHL